MSSSSVPEEELKAFLLPEISTLDDIRDDLLLSLRIFQARRARTKTLVADNDDNRVCYSAFKMWLISPHDGGTR